MCLQYLQLLPLTLLNLIKYLIQLGHSSTRQLSESLGHIAVMDEVAILAHVMLVGAYLDFFRVTCRSRPLMRIGLDVSVITIVGWVRRILFNCAVEAWLLYRSSP